MRKNEVVLLIDVTIEDSSGAPNWQVIGQWHQQPDFENGESWENYPEAGKSVPIAINYNFFSNSDSSYSAIKNDPQTATLHGYNPEWNNVSTISLSYGNPPKAIAVMKIEKNTWYTIKLHIRWGEDENGFVQAWVNGNEFTDGRHYGVNMLNSASHYFKFGLYRNPGILYTNSIYYDDIIIW